MSNKSKRQSIYYDKRNRTIYYDKKSKNGYVIPDNQMQRFNIFQNRYMVSLCVGILLYAFLDFKVRFGDIQAIAICAGIAVLIGAIMEYYFRFKLLPSFTIIEKFKPENELAVANNKNNPYSTLPKNRIIITIAFNLILGAAMIISVFFIKADNTIKMLGNVAMVILGSFSLYTGINHYLMFKKGNK